MKYILAVALVFSQIFVAKAQYPDDNDLPKNDRVKTITLAPQTSPTIIPVSQPIAGIRILPFCGDTTRLGFVQVGMMNKKISAAPDKPWDHYLQDFVDAQYKSAFSDAGAQILWVIKDLRINERTFAVSEKAYVRIKADIYRSNDKSHYHQIGTLDTVLLRGGMDVTHKHDQNIMEVLQILWTMSGGNPAASSETSLSPEDIIAKEQQRLATPITQATSYQPGVYKNYEEFRNNAPSVTQFKVEVKKRKAEIYELDAQGNTTLVARPWGICKDGELYKYNENTLIPIEKSGHGFVVSNYLDQINRKNKSIFWGGMIGGISGAVIGGKAGTVYTVTTIPYITRQQPDATTIDVDNGELMF